MKTFRPSRASVCRPESNFPPSRSHSQAGFRVLVLDDGVQLNLPAAFVLFQRLRAKLPRRLPTLCSKTKQLQRLLLESGNTLLCSSVLCRSATSAGLSMLQMLYPSCGARSVGCLPLLQGAHTAPLNSAFHFTLAKQTHTMACFHLGNDTFKVPMELHRLNRERLTKSFVEAVQPR